MNVSLSELVVILLIALLVIKPEQLPEVAFTIGRMMKGVRRLFGKFKDEMNGLIDAAEKPDKRQ